MTSFCAMRISNVTEFLNRWMMRSFVLMLTVTVLLLTPRVMAAGEAAAAPTCEAGTHQVAGQCTPDPAPAPPVDTAPIASSLDYATESVLIVEGQNPDTTPVVKVTFPDGTQIWIPEEDPSGGHVTPMWLDNSPLYSGGWLLQVNDTTGETRWLDVHDRLTFNDDVTTDVPEDAPVQLAAFTASTDQYGAGAGAVCGTDAQCATWSKAHGEVPSGYAALPHPPHTFTSAERRAARLILARLKAHKPIAEDWTYAGAPRVVGAHNDALLDAAEDAGLHGPNWTRSSKARAWLSQVVRTGKSVDSSHSKA